MLRLRHDLRRHRHITQRLNERAAADLQFIRQAMEHSSRFTAVPGKGIVLMGATAIVAALVAGPQDSDSAWLLVWGIAAALALWIGTLAMAHKAIGHGTQVFGAPARKFALGLA